MIVLPILTGLLPVLLFLMTLIVLDSYKLVRARWVLLAILAGITAAGLSLWINGTMLDVVDMNAILYTRYAAPVVEESLKAGFVMFLLKTKRIGFMVDAAIFGFAVGAGFALAENIYFLQAIETPNLLLWILRGFGTAIMHGGTTAIFGVVSKNLSDRYPAKSAATFIPGIAAVIIIHSFFNHFFLPPVLETLFFIIALPAVFVTVFKQSERSTREWLGVGLDADMELLHVITTGNLSDSNIGRYLHSLREKFPGEMIADMICLLRLHTELALRAKGILMMRNLGFSEAPDPEIREKFQELRYLDKSLGATGKLAIAPFLHTSSRDLWQIYMIEK
ncbi:MAG TPA: PrsW family glutamic-type intramembrane protease [Bacteroidota bacterium]|nr:PrsW family glutamic-type intramembrane protease [Bacteroidota bacterium]